MLNYLLRGTNKIQLGCGLTVKSARILNLVFKVLFFLFDKLDCWRVCFYNSDLQGLQPTCYVAMPLN